MDPVSLERLAALKRQLPRQLPLPNPKPAQPQPTVRNPLETIQNPDRLFAELMNASPDGHVPAHLLKRLRHLEQQRLGNTAGQAMNGDCCAEQELYSLFEALLGEEESRFPWVVSSFPAAWCLPSPKPCPPPTQTSFSQTGRPRPEAGSSPLLCSRKTNSPVDTFESLSCLSLFLQVSYNSLYCVIRLERTDSGRSVAIAEAGTLPSSFGSSLCNPPP